MTIKELENNIRHANIAYWNDNAPIMSDTEYDKLVEQLKNLDPNNKLLEHIGGTKGKYRHRVPMLSLNKAYSKEDILKWINGVARSKDEAMKIKKGKFEIKKEKEEEVPANTENTSKKEEK